MPTADAASCDIFLITEQSLLSSQQSALNATMASVQWQQHLSDTELNDIKMTTERLKQKKSI